MKTYLILFILFLNGCSIIAKINNPELEYYKTASIICDGNYYVLLNGEVTNDMLLSFKSMKELNIDLHPVAAENLSNHLHCLNIVKEYAIKNDIKTSHLSDNYVIELKNLLLNNIKLIAIEKENDKSILKKEEI